MSADEAEDISSGLYHFPLGKSMAFCWHHLVHLGRLSTFGYTGRPTMGRCRPHLYYSRPVVPFTCSNNSEIGADNKPGLRTVLGATDLIFKIIITLPVPLKAGKSKSMECISTPALGTWLPPFEGSPSEPFLQSLDHYAQKPSHRKK